MVLKFFYINNQLAQQVILVISYLLYKTVKIMSNEC